MKYILRWDLDIETTQNLGVFSTVEKAQSAAKKKDPQIIGWEQFDGWSQALPKHLGYVIEEWVEDVCE